MEIRKKIKLKILHHINHSDGWDDYEVVETALSADEIDAIIKEKPFGKLSENEQYYALLYKVITPIKKAAVRIIEGEEEDDVAEVNLAGKADMGGQVMLAKNFYEETKDRLGLSRLEDFLMPFRPMVMGAFFAIKPRVDHLLHKKEDLPKIPSATNLQQVGYEIASAPVTYANSDEMIAVIKEVIDQPYFKDFIEKAMVEYAPLTEFVSAMIAKAKDGPDTTQKALPAQSTMELPTPWPLTNGFGENTRVDSIKTVPCFSGIDSRFVKDWGQFSIFVDTLADSSYIASDAATKLSFTYIMTGRHYEHFRPEIIPWLRLEDITPLYWIRKNMFPKANYKDIASVFPGIIVNLHHTERYSRECKQLIPKWLDMFPFLKETR